VLIAAAVCPHPPVLVPSVAAHAAPELDDCRAACQDVLTDLSRHDPGLLVVVGAGPDTRRYAQGTRGSLHGFGVDVTAHLGRARVPEPATLPLSLCIGAWLLARVDWRGAVLGQQIRSDAAPEECAAVGHLLAGLDERVAMLVMADGSARRGPAAPGYADPRSAAVDVEIEEALAAGDPSRLEALDPVLAADVMCGGRAALQVLAGAAASADWQGEVTYADDPYGVWYVVASWTSRTGPAGRGVRRE
jgi:hypothetical protein